MHLAIGFLLAKSCIIPPAPRGCHYTSTSCSSAATEIQCPSSTAALRARHLASTSRHLVRVCYPRCNGLKCTKHCLEEPPPAPPPVTGFPTPYPSLAPTSVPTMSPTPVPTVTPTPHPCDDGSHGCNTDRGGICYKESGNRWGCACKSGYWCSGGCLPPYYMHTCTQITPLPTLSPTLSPTTVPTYKPCTDGTQWSIIDSQCKPCPADSAGVGGQCIRCDSGSRPNAGKMYCEPEIRFQWANVVIGVLGVLVAGGGVAAVKKHCCACGVSAGAYQKHRDSATSHKPKDRCSRNNDDGGSGSGASGRGCHRGVTKMKRLFIIV